MRDSDSQKMVSLPQAYAYLIPGRGRSLNDYLGNILIKLGCHVIGREIITPFTRLRFSEQLDLVKADLVKIIINNKSNSRLLLVGESYGGYLLMHSLAEFGKPYPGHILLLSPVLGPAAIRQNGLNALYVSRPPRANKLLELAISGQFPAPKNLEIIIGDLDKGGDPILASTIAENIPNTKIFIANNQPHQLDTSIIEKALIKILECIKKDCWQPK